MTLDDRLNSALGGAYRSTFGAAPAVLPAAARGHTVAISAGVSAVAVVAAAVAVPLALNHSSSGTTAIRAGGHGALLQSGTPVCGAGDVKVSAFINRRSFTESEFEHVAGTPMNTVVAYPIVTGTSATACRSYVETASIGFVTPSGTYVDFNGPACGGTLSETRHNATGSEPVVDPLLSAPCPDERIAFPASSGHTVVTGVAPGRPAPVDGTVTPPARPSTLPTRPAAAPAVPVSGTPSLSARDRQDAVDDENDYGVLLSSSGTIAAPADGLGSDAYNHQLAEIRAGRGPKPEPVYSSLVPGYCNDPVINAAGGNVGTWKLRVTFGDITVETPFQVTAG